MGVELVIFDCDGVLVDSEIVAVEIEAELLAAAGFAIGVDEIIDRFVGLSYPDMVRTITEEHGRPVPADLRERLAAATLAAFSERLRAVTGMAELLGELSQLRCVASSSDLARIELSLRVTGLDRWFDPGLVFSATMVERGKPAPDLFLHAAEEMGVEPPECLVLEDSPHGVEAARRAGMMAVGFVGGSHARPALASRLTRPAPSPSSSGRRTCARSCDGAERRPP